MLHPPTWPRPAGRNGDWSRLSSIPLPCPPPSPPLIFCLPADPRSERRRGTLALFRSSRRHPPPPDAPRRSYRFISVPPPISPIEITFQFPRWQWRRRRRFDEDGRSGARIWRFHPFPTKYGERRRTTSVAINVAWRRYSADPVSARLTSRQSRGKFRGGDRAAEI